MYAFFEGQPFFNKFLSGSPYGLDLYDEEQMNLLPDAFQSPKAIYTSMGKEDSQEQVKSYLDFCEKLESKSFDNFSFKYELVPFKFILNNSFLRLILFVFKSFEF